MLEVSEWRKKAEAMLKEIEEAESPKNPVVIGKHMVINDWDRYVANLKTDLEHAKEGSRLYRAIHWRIYDLKVFLKNGIISS